MGVRRAAQRVVWGFAIANELLAIAAAAAGLWGAWRMFGTDVTWPTRIWMIAPWPPPWSGSPSSAI